MPDQAANSRQHTVATEKNVNYNTSIMSEKQQRSPNMYVESSKASQSFYQQLREVSPNGTRYVDTLLPSRVSMDRNGEHNFERSENKPTDYGVFN